MGNSFARHKEEEVVDIKVDEGHVAPLKDGVYANAQQDWDAQVVKRLIVERRMAPFYKGLADYDESTNITPCPTPTSATPSTPVSNRASVVPETFSPREGLVWAPARRTSHDRHPSTSSTFSLRGKRSVSMPSQLIQQESMSLIRQEDLYKYAVECPICFLYYPANVNYSRCCDHPICTECFVQIKRPEATLEPAACPYCVEPNFGILYYAPGSPEYKAKIIEAHPNAQLECERPCIERATSAAAVLGMAQTDGNSGGEKQDSLVVPTAVKAKRRASVSHTSNLVVTSDDLRPEWLRKQQQLALVRAANQRRSAFPMGSHSGSSRRSRLYLETDRDLSGAAAAAAALVESMTGGSASGTSSTRSRSSRTSRNGERRRGRAHGGDMSLNYLEAVRNMGQDLEELMIMEAIRRSLQEAGANGEGSGSTDAGPSTEAASSASPSASEPPTSPSDQSDGPSHSPTGPSDAGTIPNDDGGRGSAAGDGSGTTVIVSEGAERKHEDEEDMASPSSSGEAVQSQ